MTGLALSSGLKSAVLTNLGETSSQILIEQVTLEGRFGSELVEDAYSAKDTGTGEVLTVFGLRSLLAEVRRAGPLEIRDQDFSGVDLRNLDLTESVFENCIFTRSSLMKADLSRSRFMGCEFAQADLSRTRLGETVFLNCGLTQARLSESFGRDVVFDHCDMSHADVWQAAIAVNAFVDCWGVEGMTSELDYRA